MRDRGGWGRPAPQLRREEAGGQGSGGGDAFLDPYLRLVEVLTVARLWLAQGRLDSVLALMDRLLPGVERIGQPKRTIELYLLSALALYAQGRTAQALEALERALALGAASGYVRVFLDEGAPVEELLRLALPQSAEPSYVRKLLGEFACEGSHPAPRGADTGRTEAIRTPLPPGLGAAGAAEMLLEPLSEREQQVLRLLPTHLSSTDIARELYLSPNTVRTHIKRVYAKLDVHSRDEAVQRAGELGLLS